MAVGRSTARRFAVVALGMLVTLGSMALHAEAQDEVRLDADVVVVPVSVRGAGGALVDKLTADDFVVSDDRATPEVAFFQRDVAPVDVALLVDTSASTGSTLDILERAAVDFARHLRREDAYTLLTFAEKPNVVVAWTSDTKTLKNSLTRTVPAGNTLLNMSAYIAVKVMFESRPANRRRALVIFTDGIDTGSGFYDAKRVLDAALAQDVTVYVVSANRLADEAIDRMIADGLVAETMVGQYRDLQEELRNVESALATTTESTGGRVLFPTKTGDLSGSFEQVAEELRSRYVLGFYVPDDAAPGFHAITVKVKRPGVTVRARAGYFHDPTGARP